MHCDQKSEISFQNSHKMKMFMDLFDQISILWFLSNFCHVSTKILTKRIADANKGELAIYTVIHNLQYCLQIQPFLEKKLIDKSFSNSNAHLFLKLLEKTICIQFGCKWYVTSHLKTNKVCVWTWALLLKMAEYCHT